MDQQKTTRETVLEQIEAARRKGLLRLSYEAEQQKHYSEALDGYRQIIDQYYGTPEEDEAREKMLDMAYLFESKGESYRAKHLYGLLEQLYTPHRYANVQEARQARVQEILEKIHTEERAEEERRAKLEETREF